MSSLVAPTSLVDGKMLTAADLPQQLIRSLSCPGKVTSAGCSSVSTAPSSPVATMQQLPPWADLIEEAPKVSMELLMLPDADDSDREDLDKVDEECGWQSVSRRIAVVLKEQLDDDDDDDTWRSADSQISPVIRHVKDGEDTEDCDLLSPFEEKRRWSEVGRRLSHIFMNADDDSGDEDFWSPSVCSSNKRPDPGMALLDQYNVLGAAAGSWSRP
eukprot:gnl/TRDRNA2_/TRDRNA2_84386_c0_seq1.p1 gnl/TRDRNA2_/TRDRNA2_84386_c0~~gnl/TRDRNA2_/TRDRNA2_84386_c0_seq1.p1  ORF type:complete len:215 (+),score=50.10 gnl/TRDRNA2_/TRDRNA2_84386_c0_seq1:109-753(+)